MDSRIKYFISAIALLVVGNQFLRDNVYFYSTLNIFFQFVFAVLFSSLFFLGCYFLLKKVASFRSKKLPAISSHELFILSFSSSMGIYFLSDFSEIYFQVIGAVILVYSFGVALSVWKLF